MKFGYKYIRELVIGDVVHFYGGIFQVEDTLTINPDTPDEFYVARAKWIGGDIIQGYFGPHKDWVFQGNDFAGQRKVEIKEIA